MSSSCRLSLFVVAVALLVGSSMAQVDMGPLPYDYWNNVNCSGGTSYQGTDFFSFHTNYTMDVCLNATSDVIQYYWTTPWNQIPAPGDIWNMHTIVETPSSLKEEGKTFWVDSYWFGPKGCVGEPDQTQWYLMDACWTSQMTSFLLSYNLSAPFQPAGNVNSSSLTWIDVDNIATECQNSPSTYNCTSTQIVWKVFAGNDANCSGEVVETALFIYDTSGYGNTDYKAGTCYFEQYYWGQPFTFDCISGDSVRLTWYTDSNCTNIASMGTYKLQAGTNRTTCQNFDSTWATWTGMNNNASSMFQFECSTLVSPPTGAPGAPEAPGAQTPALPSNPPSSNPSSSSSPSDSNPSSTPSDGTPSSGSPGAPPTPSSDALSIKTHLTDSLVLALLLSVSLLLLL